MRVFIQSPDRKGQINGSVLAILSQFDRVQTKDEADVIFTPISFFHDFTCNRGGPALNKPWVMFDFMEYEWSWGPSDGTHLFGHNTEEFRWLKSNSEWQRFSDWVRDNPPIVYFKRELLARDVSDTVKPIEWPCLIPESVTESEQRYNERRLEVYFNWGFSHPSRPALHAKIFQGMNNGIGVISEPYQFPGYMQNPMKRTWMTVFCPWYCRKPMNEVLSYQRAAKISVSLFGAGRKCFRHSEAPVDSVMALQEDELAWSYPWIDQENCIRLVPGEEFETLETATMLDLYPVYLKSQETIAKYRLPTYARDYLTPLIESKL